MTNGRRPEPEPAYRWWHRLPISILISVAFFIGAYRISESSENLDGVVLLTVAVILIGVWITVELHDKFYGEHKQQIQYIVRSEVEAIREDIIEEKEGDDL